MAEEAPKGLGPSRPDAMGPKSLWQAPSGPRRAIKRARSEETNAAPAPAEPAAMETSKPVEGKPAAEKRALDETENADQNVPPQKKQSPGVQGKTEPVISAQEAAAASEC